MESPFYVMCKKYFTCNDALRKHYRLKHPGMEQPSKKSGRSIKNLVIKKDCTQSLKAFANSKATKVHETIVQTLFCCISKRLIGFYGLEKGRRQDYV